MLTRIASALFLFYLFGAPLYCGALIWYASDLFVQIKDLEKENQDLLEWCRQ